MSLKDPKEYLKLSKVQFEKQNYDAAVSNVWEALTSVHNLTDQLEVKSIVSNSLDIISAVLKDVSTNQKKSQVDIAKVMLTSKGVFESSHEWLKGKKDKDFENKLQDLKTSIGCLDASWLQERELLTNLAVLHKNSANTENAEELARNLSELALAYLKESSEKSNFIKAGLFLKTALQITKSNKRRVEKDIKTFNRSLLKACGAKTRIADFHEISQCIYKKNISVMRENMATFNKELDKLGEDYNLEDYDQDSPKYIEKVQTTISTILDNYAEIMNEVSKKCVEILGQPPCKFSHMAMGQKLVGQVCDGSGMPSAVLLENDVKKKENFSDVLEYFHWYYTIFHVVIAYFGDTSLNAQYFASTERKFALKFQKNDSLMHEEIDETNSIFSLSNESSNEINLVKTVKDMVKTFSKEDGSDETKSIAIMLTRTRHIGGNESIHKKFQKRVRKLIYSKDCEASDFKRNLLTNSAKVQLPSFTFHQIFNADKSFEVSDVQVRSAKLMISFVDTLGHLAHVEKNSLFSVIGSLVSKGHINDKAGAALRQALAASIEIILRFTNQVFTSREGDLNASKSQPTLENRKLQILLLTASEVCKVKAEILASDGNIKGLKINPMKIVDVGDKAEILACFGWYMEALTCIDKDLPNSHRWRNTAFVHFMRGLCLSKLERRSEANESLKSCLAFLSSLAEVDQAKISHYVQYLIGTNMLHMGNYKEAKNHLNQAKKTLESSGDLPMHDGENLYFKTLNAEANIDYLEGDYHSACAKSKELVALCNLNSADSREAKLRSLDRQAECLLKLGQYNECISLLERELSMNGSFKIEEDADICSFGTAEVSWMVKIADCYFRLNNIKLSEKYCKIALRHEGLIQKSTPCTFLQIKLIYSQCHLWQGRHKEASQEACEATLSCLDFVEYPKSEKLLLIQAAVTVISRSITPVRALDFEKEEQYKDDDRIIISNASRVLDALCDQRIFEGNELERDKSVLIRVIQSGLFRINQYNKILTFFKNAVDISLDVSSEDHSVTNALINLIESNQFLRDNCERNGDYLCEMGKFCNVRDSFSISGAVIVYSGCFYKSSKTAECNFAEAFKEWISQQRDESKNTVLHCAVKLAKHVVKHFLTKITNENIVSSSSKVPFLDFVSDIYELLKSCSSNDIIQETASLVTTLAECWMKFENYDKGLSLLNDALQLQEKLAMDVTNVAYIDSSAIIQNIGICLAKLGRWEEANSYLHRGSAMKERRRKSRAYEDYSMIHARIKSARCSFSLGNYQEAVFMASTAFHDGIFMDSIENQDDSMISAVSIVLKSALAVSVHAQVDADKGRIQPEVIAEVLKRATTLRSTLEEQSESLGSAYSEIVESLYYACGNCLFVLEEYKQALKSFKKSIRIMKQKGNLYVGIKKPITLNIAKCLIGLGKYTKAEKSLNRFLAMESEKNLIIHLHPSHAHVLLSVCAIRRHFYRSSCDHATRALQGALNAESEMLKQAIARSCTDVFLRMLKFELSPLDLD